MVILYRVLAAVTFGLAVAGIVLPVLPTTPFLLLTSWFLVRSSPTLHARLHQSTLFGPFLRDWERHHGVRPHVKVTAIGSMSVAIALSLAFAELRPWQLGLLVALVAWGLVVVLRLPVIREPDDPGE